MKLIVEPHIDDAAIGCGLLMSKLAQKNEAFAILSVSYYNYNQRDVRAKKALKALFENEYNFSKLYHYHLDPTYEIRTFFPQHYEYIKLNMSYNLNKINKSFDITEVYIPSADNHIDHEVINRICKQIFRPVKGSKIDTIIEYEIPNSKTLEFGSNNADQSFNYFIFGSKSDHNFKRKLLDNYIENYNLKEKDDFRSAEFVLKHNELIGYKYGYDSGERYKIIFKK